jgi:YggT family protein
MLTSIKILMNFIVTISFDLMIFVVTFHFLLELMGTHHQQPIKRFIIHYTQPLLDPLHKIFPIYRNVDFGLLGLLFILENIKLVLLFFLAWQFPNLALLFVWSIFLIINSVVNFYFFAVLFRLLISWVIPVYSNYPVAQILFIITEPVLRPIRQRFPITGFDWTSLVVIIGLKIISMVVIYAAMLLGAPSFL